MADEKKPPKQPEQQVAEKPMDKRALLSELGEAETWDDVAEALRKHVGAKEVSNSARRMIRRGFRQVL